MNVPVVRARTMEHAETKLTASTAHAQEGLAELRAKMVRMLQSRSSELPLTKAT